MLAEVSAEICAEAESATGQHVKGLRDCHLFLKGPVAAQDHNLIQQLNDA